MNFITVWAVLCVAASSALGHNIGERRSLAGLISASDLIVFAQIEDATTIRHIKNLGPIYLTQIKVFQNIRGKAPSRYLIFSGQGETPARYEKGTGAIIFLNKTPKDSPFYNTSSYLGLQTNEEKILLSGVNDLAIINAVRKISVALGISDPPVRKSTLKNLFLDLLTHPEERIRQDAVSDLTRLVYNSDGASHHLLSRNDLERLVRVASSGEIDLFTREETVFLLGKMKEIESLLVLIKVEPESLRMIVIDMLGTCQDERAVEPLIDIARQGEGTEVKTAIFALGKIGGQRSQKFLKKLARTERGEVRQWAQEAMAHKGK